MLTQQQRKEDKNYINSYAKHHKRAKQKAKQKRDHVCPIQYGTCMCLVSRTHTE